MQKSTTIRVSAETRDALRELAHTDRVTLDEEIRRLTRAERQRRFGSALASPLSDDDERWLDMAASTIDHDARR